MSCFVGKVKVSNRLLLKPGLPIFFILSLFLHLVVRNHVQATVAETFERRQAKDNKELAFEIDSPKSFSEAIEMLTKTRVLKIENLYISFWEFKDRSSYDDFWKVLFSSKPKPNKSFAAAVAAATNSPGLKSRNDRSKAQKNNFFSSASNTSLLNFELNVSSDLQEIFDCFVEKMTMSNIFSILKQCISNFSSIFSDQIEKNYANSNLTDKKYYESFIDDFRNHFELNLNELQIIKFDTLSVDQSLRLIFQSLIKTIFYQKLNDIFIEPFAKNSEHVTLCYNLKIPLSLKPMSLNCFSANSKSLQLKGFPNDFSNTALFELICSISNLPPITLDSPKLTEQFLSFVSDNELKKLAIRQKKSQCSKYSEWTQLKLRFDDYNNFQASKLETLKSLSSLEKLTIIDFPVNYSAYIYALKKIATLNNALTIEIVDFTSIISFPGLRICPTVGSRLEITASDLVFVFKDGRKVSNTELTSIQSDSKKLTELKHYLYSVHLKELLNMDDIFRDIYDSSFPDNKLISTEQLISFIYELTVEMYDLSTHRHYNAVDLQKFLKDLATFIELRVKYGEDEDPIYESFLTLKESVAETFNETMIRKQALNLLTPIQSVIEMSKTVNIVLENSEKGNELNRIAECIEKIKRKLNSSTSENLSQLENSEIMLELLVLHMSLKENPKYFYASSKKDISFQKSIKEILQFNIALELELEIIFRIIKQQSGEFKTQ